MNEQLLQAINQRIDEHHAFLSDRLDALQGTMESLHATLAARIEAHEAYHRRNEHRFGMIRLAERHPIRLATLMFVAGGAALATAPGSIRWLVQAATALKNLLP